LPEEYVTKMMKGIVGFEIEIARLTGKFKMSQNRTERERERITAELEACQDDMIQEVARLVAGARRRE
jgi:transcriptional regulator